MSSTFINITDASKLVTSQVNKKWLKNKFFSSTQFVIQWSWIEEMAANCGNKRLSSKRKRPLPQGAEG